MTLKFKTLSDTIAAGAQSTVSWAPERDVHIRKLLIVEQGGAALQNVHVQIMVSDVPYTRTTVPAHIFAQYYNQVPPFDLVLPKGVKIEFKTTNSTASSVTLYYVIAYEEGG